jgi:hypothetical protein
MKEPLTPHRYGDGTLPPSPQIAPAPQEPGETPEAYRLRVDTDARVFSLKLQLQWAEADYKKSLAKAERDLVAERAETAKIILDLRKRIEYLEQGPLLNKLHPQAENPIPESENLCPKKNQ